MVFSRLWRSSDPITLPKEYMDLLNLCLNSTNFQYYSKLYQQLHGTVVRSPVSFAVAEIVMQNIEERAFSTCRQSIPLPLRYVDETPPQDTTKSTHSTIIRTKKTLTHNSLSEDMIWMGAYMLSISNIYVVWGSFTDKISNMDILMFLDQGVLVIERCHDVALVNDNLIMLSLQFQVTFWQELSSTSQTQLGRDTATALR